ncbi:hypothetical protein L596_004956 [Steinernema carpocapsae]|uniref:RING-type domain-containing protein n=1 Tax=Steinernema carpocapsae TaxID=34508 RepID=A0A4U8UZ17_STECR|nr:hypothetical protein L596_004956 [Steinernema carpocapsae]
MEVLSDYGTLSNGSCDEDGSCHSSGEEQEFSIGVCPKCRRLFQFPVSLQCGHSLCRACSQLLLDKTGRSGRSSHSSGHRPRVRMGLSSYSSLDVRTSVNVRNQLYSKDILSPMYLSPACPVCHEPPKTVPPVPNYALQNLIDSLMIRNNMMSVQSGFKSNCPIPRNMRNPNSIKEVTIGIVGGSRVGKTQLRHCQLLNGVFFPSSNRSASQYMINLVENPCVDAVDGLVLVYDIAKEKSFDQLVEIERNLTLKENIPIILVGNKADRKKKRQVDSHVAQSFARQVGCPFREVSARCNDGVSESFGDLLHLLDVRV